jgi:histone H3/H4
MAKKKAAGGAKSKKAGGSDRSYVVASKAKEFLKGKDCNVASDALTGLNSVCEWYLQQAAARAKENGRKTVRPHDFIIG